MQTFHTLIVIGLCAGASAALASDWSLRSGDTPLTIREATDLTRDSTLVFYDDGQSKYSAGGSYSYTYSATNGGGTAFGVYTIQADGSICVTFRNGFDRCDLYVRSGDRLVLITQDGDRYPIRP